MLKKNLNIMFSNLCCSKCRADFTEESFDILRQEDEFSVVQITCTKCGKSFGAAFLGENSICPKLQNPADKVFELYDGPMPISSDEVIDAHKFIKNLSSDWTKHLPKEFRDNKHNLTK